MDRVLQHEEFVESVRQRDGLGTHEEAERAARSTLAALGKPLPEAQAAQLSEQLPEGLAERLERQPSEPEKVSNPNDFLHRVGQGEGERAPEVEAHIRAASMAVLGEAAGPARMQSLRSQLPDGPFRFFP